MIDKITCLLLTLVALYFLGCYVLALLDVRPVVYSLWTTFCLVLAVSAFALTSTGCSHAPLPPEPTSEDIVADGFLEGFREGQSTCPPGRKERRHRISNPGQRLMEREARIKARESK